MSYQQAKTLYNMANLNTKILAKDRHLFLLHMLGSVCKGGKVGETEFTRVSNKGHAETTSECVISENFSDCTGQHKSGRTNRMP